MTAPAWSQRHKDREGDVFWCQPRDGLGTWQRTAPHHTTRWTRLGVLSLALLLAALFVAGISGGQRLMCATHKTTAGHGALTYCPDYQPTETPR